MRGETMLKEFREFIAGDNDLYLVVIVIEELPPDTVLLTEIRGLRKANGDSGAPEKPYLQVQRIFSRL
jgi:hypothetical protein